MYFLPHLSLGVTIHPCYCTAIAWVWGALSKLFIRRGSGSWRGGEHCSLGRAGKESVHFSGTVSYPFTSLQGFIPLLGPREINVRKRDGRFLTLAVQEGLSPQNTLGVIWAAEPSAILKIRLSMSKTASESRKEPLEAFEPAEGHWALPSPTLQVAEHSG